MRGRIAAALVLFVACGEDSGAQDVSDTEYIGEDIPAGNCGETDNAPCESSESGAPDGDCQGSADCSGDMICAASFDGDIGAFACRTSCVDDRDESMWCTDDAACCNPGSTCRRGYCLPDAQGGDDTGAGTDSSTGGAGAPEEAPNRR